MCAGLSYIWVLFVADNSHKLTTSITYYFVVICCLGENSDFPHRCIHFDKGNAMVSKHIIVYNVHL